MLGVTFLMLLLLSGTVHSFQSPLLSQLWEQSIGMSDETRARLHLDLSQIDQLEVRLRTTDRHTAERLSLEVRERFREVLKLYQLSVPLQGAVEEVEFEDTWAQEVWTRARQLPFSEEVVNKVLNQLRRQERMQRHIRHLSSQLDSSQADLETAGEEVERVVREARRHREMVLDHLSQESHQLVHKLRTLEVDNFTKGLSEIESKVILEEITSLDILIRKQRELERFAAETTSLPDTFHKMVLLNTHKIHEQHLSITSRQRREEL